MTVERRVDATAADTESTGLIKRVNAPLPPYAQQRRPAGPAAPPSAPDAATVRPCRRRRRWPTR